MMLKVMWVGSVSVMMVVVWLGVVFYYVLRLLLRVRLGLLVEWELFVVSFVLVVRLCVKVLVIM